MKTEYVIPNTVEWGTLPVGPRQIRTRINYQTWVRDLPQPANRGNCYTNAYFEGPRARPTPAYWGNLPGVVDLPGYNDARAIFAAFQRALPPRTPHGRIFRDRFQENEPVFFMMKYNFKTVLVCETPITNRGYIGHFNWDINQVIRIDRDRTPFPILWSLDGSLVPIRAQWSHDKLSLPPPVLREGGY